MGYFRHVITDHLPLQAAALALDHDRAALRFLKPTSIRDVMGSDVADPALLLNTGSLAAPFCDERMASHFYNVGGQTFYIFAEAVLDRREPEFARLWVPGTHFVFHFDRNRGLMVDVRGALTGTTRRNTAELIRHSGGIWMFDLWVTDPNLPVDLCNRSVTTAPNTLLLTNISDLGEVWQARDVMRGSCSKWLTLEYRLTSDSETVKPDDVVWMTFEVLDGKTGCRARTISWDGWRIEAVDGYAPSRRIKVQNGVGRFRVQALGLLSGETMRVKVQNRFDPSIAECTVKVV